MRRPTRAGSVWPTGCSAPGVTWRRRGQRRGPAIYAGGVFERNPDGTEAPIAVPGWVELPLRQVIAVGDRVLDLRTGVVGRLVVSDGSVMLRSARWACLARPGTKVLIADGGAVLPETLIMHETIDERSSLGGGVRPQIDTTGTREPRDGQPGRCGAAGGGLCRLAQTSPFTCPHPAPAVRGLGIGADRALGRAAFGLGRPPGGERPRGGQRCRTDPGRPFALFHLATTASEHGEGPVGPRGLTGAGYFGHVLWDADAFVLPVLAATHPASARSMLEYRIRRLRPPAGWPRPRAGPGPGSRGSRRATAPTSLRPPGSAPTGSGCPS